MKKNFKKIAVIFSVVVLMLAALAVTAFAEKADFTPPANYPDISPANGWVHLASRSAAADPDGNDIELYFISVGDVYFNPTTKTLAFVGAGSLTAGYGDWMVRDSSTMNKPGGKYFIGYWASQNASKVETIELRDCSAFNNGGYVLGQFSGTKTVKLNPNANGTNGSKADTGMFTGMSSLVTVGHGTFTNSSEATPETPAGTFTPITYKEGVVDLTGFTYLRVQGGRYDQKEVLYHGSTLYNAASVTEVILPASLKYSGKYTPNIKEGDTWGTGPEVDATTDSYGGEYSGIIPKQMFKGAELLNKVTVPEGVTLKLIEKDAFNGCISLRCITIKGSVDPNVTIEENAFKSVGKGCIIQCANAADIEVLNSKLAAAGVTTVTAVDMNTQPTPPPVITKLPKTDWTPFDSTGATAHGTITRNTWSNSDVKWAWYEDTKTLKFSSESKQTYVELGDLAGCSDGGWTPYLDAIEHIVIGPGITKLTANTINNMPNLVDVEMTSDISQASGAFTGVPKLKTIFITGMEKVEGQAMLAGARTNFVLNLTGTSIETVHMGSSTWSIKGKITVGPTTHTLIFDDPSQEMIDFCKESYLNIQDSSGKVLGEWFVPIPEGTVCGDNATFTFDEATGTLTIGGKGPTMDIINYYGGGSKTQPWFSIKNQIKHVVIGDYITDIGKYNFTQCENLETVEIPATEGFNILVGAFEWCESLTSIYVRGNKPVAGTLDLTPLPELYGFTFNYCGRIANVIVNGKIDKIASSTFDEMPNLKNIYSTPGSVGEEYAEKNELTFFDISKNSPAAVVLERWNFESTSEVEPESGSESVSDTESQTVDTEEITTAPETTSDDKAPSQGSDKNKKGGSILPIIIVIVAVVVVAAAAVVVVIIKKKKGGAPKAPETIDAPETPEE